MVIFIALIAGIAGAVYGFKKSFFALWAIFFNIIIAVYLGIMLTPWIMHLIAEQISNQQHILYYAAGSIIVVALAVFTFLQIFAAHFFTESFDISLPQLFDKIGSVIFGFLSGFIATSFILLAINIFPFMQYSIIQKFYTKPGQYSPIVAPVVGTCNFVSKVSLQVYEEKAGEIITEIIDMAAKKGETEQEDAANEKFKNNTYIEDCNK